MLYVHTALLNMMEILWSTHVDNKSVTAWSYLMYGKLEKFLFYSTLLKVQSASDRALYICYNNVSAGSHGVHQYQHQIIRGVVLKARTALGFASCCITFSTTPLVLYLPYSARNHAITYTYGNLAFCVSHVFILCTYAGYFTTAVSVLIS